MSHDHTNSHTDHGDVDDLIDHVHNYMAQTDDHSDSGMAYPDINRRREKDGGEGRKKRKKGQGLSTDEFEGPAETAKSKKKGMRTSGGWGDETHIDHDDYDDDDEDDRKYQPSAPAADDNDIESDEDDDDDSDSDTDSSLRRREEELRKERERRKSLKKQKRKSKRHLDKKGQIEELALAAPGDNGGSIANDSYKDSKEHTPSDDEDSNKNGSNIYDGKRQVQSLSMHQAKEQIEQAKATDLVIADRERCTNITNKILDIFVLKCLVNGICRKCCCKRCHKTDRSHLYTTITFVYSWLYFIGKLKVKEKVKVKVKHLNVFFYGLWYFLFCFFVCVCF